MLVGLSVADVAGGGFRPRILVSEMITCEEGCMLAVAQRN